MVKSLRLFPFAVDPSTNFGECVMRQKLVQTSVRFSAEHMEAIRRHFNEAQQCVGNLSGTTDGKTTKDEKFLFDVVGKFVDRSFRDLVIETELLLPEWRAVAAYFALGSGVVLILGIYLLPN